MGKEREYIRLREVNMFFDLRTFSPDTEADAIAVVNAYTVGWPWTRPIDGELVAHWKTLGNACQPERMLLAYREGEARAFLHGERDRECHSVHLLAIRPGALEEGVGLLAQAEAQARAEGARVMCGPTCNSGRFYGGYVLGLEPYHPHWAVEATQAFVQAGYHMAQCEAFMVAAPPTPMAEAPAGYEIVEAACEAEYGARAFRLVARQYGNEAASCGGRVYPELRAPNGGAVGQIGPVGTEEPHRGKGLATALTTRALARLWEGGAAEVLISTGLENWAALRAYEKAGFRRVHNLNEWQKGLTKERKR